MKEALTFDDVALVPRYNNVKSRTEPDLSTWLTKNVEVGMPLIPANMDTVIGPELARIIRGMGGVPIFHRFTDLKTQESWVEEFEGNVFLSCGLGEDNNLTKILDLQPRGVCLDVAHGHSESMVGSVGWIKKHYPKIEVIAGNVCTARAYHDLVNAGVDAVKVGIGAGAACTTRVVTGFGVPQFTAIKDCAEEAQHFRIPIIADGGIRNSADIVKALAAGAATVMVGKLFAFTKESSAEKRSIVHYRRMKEYEGIPETVLDLFILSRSPNEAYTMEIAKYRGQASKDFQEEYYGGLKHKTIAEGVDFWAPVAGSAQQVIDELLGGLRSGMTYAGARTITELHRKAEFVKVTSACNVESNPRGH